jgi:hypothetical protein
MGLKGVARSDLRRMRCLWMVSEMRGDDMPCKSVSRTAMRTTTRTASLRQPHHQKIPSQQGLIDNSREERRANGV